jgi:hypothetical protein
MEVEKLKYLRDQIKELEKDEHFEILRIIRENSENKFTENNNGIFINMNKLDFTTLDKVEQFLEFSRKNKLNFDNESTFEN